MVGVKVYGKRPSIFKEIKNIIREASSRAHLWPGTLIGLKSSYVNRLMNQLWRVSSRLFSHRVVGAGSKSHGSVSARAIRGTPRYIGLSN